MADQAEYEALVEKDPAGVPDPDIDSEGRARNLEELKRAFAAGEISEESYESIVGNVLKWQP